MESETVLARRLIQNANLCHPDLPLVESFICDAKDSGEAARYLLKLCEDDINGMKFRSFVEDWKSLVKLFYNKNPLPATLSPNAKEMIGQRDNNRCCITGSRSRFWNDCAIFPIVPLIISCLREHKKERLYDLLGSFISPIQRDRLLSDQGGIAKETSRNYWVLNRDIAKSFSTGELSLEDLGANKYEICYKLGGRRPKFHTTARLFGWKSHLIDHSQSGIASPDPVFLEVHHRFATALKWTHVATNMRATPPKSITANTSIEDGIVIMVLAIWLTFPRMIRLLAYRLLKIVGSYLYAGTIAYGVHRLPFGLYLKYGHRTSSDRYAREYEALKLVRSRTSIPVPRPIDLITSSNGIFLITSRVEGEPAGLDLDIYSDEEIDVMAKQLQIWIAELHAIQKPTDSKFDILGVRGGSILDYRVETTPVGPFRTEKEFSESLRLGALPGLVHRHDHEIFFTHADLNMRNILTKDGMITAIIDWENAGWYPAYWEYTKCHFGVRLSQRWLNMVDTVFDHKFQEELQIERQYWLFQAI